MVPVKIQCGCGQRYAFEAEPVDGRLAVAVNCPACGADGTAAANEVIGASPDAAPAAPPPVAQLHLSAAEPSTHTPRKAGMPNPSQLGMVDRQQAEVEARAKVSWGDPPEAVLQYLMIQGFSHADASALIKTMYSERALLVRGKGVKKILTGVVLIIAGAAGALYMLLVLKVISTTLLGLTLGLVLWGCWLVINGIIMVAVPRMQSGDVAE